MPTTVIGAIWPNKSFHLDSLCPTPLGKVGSMLKYNNNISGNAGSAKL